MDGTKMVIGGREFVVPPATVKTAKVTLRLARSLEAGLDDEAAFDAVVSIFHAGLRRNYPDLTIDDLEDVVPANGIQALLPEFFKAMGFEAPAPGEAQGR